MEELKWCIAKLPRNRCDLRLLTTGMEVAQSKPTGRGGIGQSSCLGA